jgi:hypothetical protein
MNATIVLEHAIEALLFNGPAIEVALDLITTTFDEEPGLLLRLNTFGDHLQTQLLGKRDDRRGYGHIIGVVRNVSDE